MLEIYEKNSPICIYICFALLALFSKEKKPNIILFLTDDQTINSTGIYGNKQVKTLTMDALAEKGVIFSNNYATTSICMASIQVIDQSLTWEAKKKYIPPLFENCSANYKYLLNSINYKGDIYDYDAIMAQVEKVYNQATKSKKNKYSPYKP